ncbi:MAG TPA: aminoacyl-histidine dipeptidase [Bacteroidales bacterium]|nr:aminoacyl-histidine dipeptidase [Bacteroidales bacterium]
MDTISTIEPKELWSCFEEILKVPRPSRKEEKIRAFLIDFAKEHSLDYKTDEAGNLLISKAAAKGFEHMQPVILQSHMDMVGEKNSDIDHDFETDPIKPRIDGDWVKAEGTTLGADDGIGIAAQMAILASDTIEHGPLECLFTIDEETGLTGANALQPGFFQSRILLNLDSEDEGELFIGCAGGVDTLINMPYKEKKVPSGHIACEVSVKGLTGGHSGDDIHKGRGNSNKILNRFLWNATRKFNIRLSSFDGGNLRNAIPREAVALVTVSESDYSRLKAWFDTFRQIIKDELRSTEAHLEMDLIKADKPAFVVNRKAQKKLLNSLYACPNGVIEWSREIDNLVETSTNLASVKFNEPENILVTTSQRSSVDSAKKDIADRIRATFEMAGAEVIHSDGYPGWQPDSDSEILKITEKAYLDLFGNKPVVRAIHAGLECGLFMDKYPDLDMVSFGPTIKGAHSPDEGIEIPTAEKFWKLLLETLKRIPGA